MVSYPCHLPALAVKLIVLVPPGRHARTRRTWTWPAAAAAVPMEVCLYIVPSLWLVHHDLQELLLIDLPVLVQIKLVNHSLTSVSGKTYSSSSSRFSPSSLATRFKLRRLILPVLSSSKSAKALRISSRGSRAAMRSVTALASHYAQTRLKAGHSMRPVPVASLSRKISRTSAFFKSNPRARIATFNSW